jgi:nucleoside-diphosphate-sugar epimerase
VPSPRAGTRVGGERLTDRVALVTGATGLVGSHIVERLVADGWRVRALVRDPPTAGWIDAAGAEPWRGDVLDPESLARAAAGCAVIHHAAAAIAARGGWEEYRRTNVDGTRHVVAAAALANARLVHVSSIAVYGGRGAARRGEAIDERAPHAPLPAHAHYARSKRESEEIVLGAHRRGELWATALRPAVVYGRRDRQFVPRVARLLRPGVAPLLHGGRTPLALVHAAAVADAAVRAGATAAAGGAAFNLSGDFVVTAERFFRLAGDGLGTGIRLVPVPVAAVRAGLAALRLAHALANPGGSRPLGGSSIEFLTEGDPYVSDRARRELGWTPPVAPEHGVPDAFRWWKEVGRW